MKGKIPPAPLSEGGIIKKSFDLIPPLEGDKGGVGFMYYKNIKNL